MEELSSTRRGKDAGAATAEEMRARVDLAPGGVAPRVVVLRSCAFAGQAPRLRRAVSTATGWWVRSDKITGMRAALLVCSQSCDEGRWARRGSAHGARLEEEHAQRPPPLQMMRRPYTGT
jgi:hypothetical protein